MLKAETTSTRAPRGTKPVSQAFFTALDAVPEASRAAVAKAAQVMIRDELKTRREKMKAAAVKEKARAKSSAAMPEPAPKAPARGRTKPIAKTNGVAEPAKRRARKTQPDVETT